MATERWTVVRNSVAQSCTAEVIVVADFVEPCAYCGIPCTGTFRVWYLDAGRRITFETDRGSLSDLLEPLVKGTIDRNEYELLPAFVRDWNEMKGWASLGLDKGSEVEADDLLATTTALERVNTDEQVSRLLISLREFVEVAVRESRELWVGET